MNHHVQAQFQHMYIPAVTLPQFTLKHSLQKIPVAIKGAIDDICGTAQRVGYTGSKDEDLAVYRLKVKLGKNLTTITLPGFFVVEDGIFTNYEQWCRNREAK